MYLTRDSRRWFVFAGLLASALLVCAGLSPASAAGGAGTDRLYAGQKLKVGQCLKDSGGPYRHTGSFCVGSYGTVTLRHQGRICTTDGPGGHTRTPSAYVTVTRNGNVVLYQYAGGRRLWESGTAFMGGGHLVLSVTSGDFSALSINVPGEAFFTFAKCR